MTDEEKTDVHERLAVLEAKVDGGPGMATICKFHQQSVDELKLRMDRMEHKLEESISLIVSRLQFWAGAIAALVVVSNIAVSVVLHFVKVKGP